MNRRARHIVASVGIAVAAVALYYAIPFVVAVASLGELCPYSPWGVTVQGVPLCHVDTPTRPGSPQAFVRPSPAVRALGKLAFVGYSGEGSASDIYVVNADGTGLRNLTTGERQGFWEPAWSPDGMEIALIGDNEYSYARWLEVLDVQSGTVKGQAHDVGLDLQVAWSPDGQRLALASQYSDDATRVDDEHSEIYLLRAVARGARAFDAHGAVVAQLTDNGKNNYEPSWSPDEAMIAFTNGNEPNGEIYAMDSDGFGQRDLSRNPANDEDPAWSPDGSRIAFVSDRSGAAQVYVMNADGSSVRRLTRTRGEKSSPAWSSDNRTIAFLNRRDNGIYVIGLDGGRPRLILTGADSDSGLSWQRHGAATPDPSQSIGFEVSLAYQRINSAVNGIEHCKTRPCVVKGGRAIERAADGGLRLLTTFRGSLPRPCFHGLLTAARDLFTAWSRYGSALTRLDSKGSQRQGNRASTLDTTVRRRAKNCTVSMSP